MNGRIERPIGASYRHGQRMSADAAHFCTIAGRNARNDMHAIRNGRLTWLELTRECAVMSVSRECAAVLGLEGPVVLPPSFAKQYVDAVCYAASMPILDPGEGKQWVVCPSMIHLHSDDACSACVGHYGWFASPIPLSSAISQVQS